MYQALTLLVTTITEETPLLFQELDCKLNSNCFQNSFQIFKFGNSISQRLGNPILSQTRDHGNNDHCSLLSIFNPDVMDSFLCNLSEKFRIDLNFGWLLLYLTFICPKGVSRSHSIFLSLSLSLTGNQKTRRSGSH